LALGGRWTRAAIVRVIALARGATVTGAVAGFERTAFGIA
jgi:hypothetical protein